MKKYHFSVLSILLMTLPLIAYRVMETDLFASISDPVFFFIFDGIQILGGFLGVIVLWHYGFRDMFRFHFKWVYLFWFPVVFISQYIWSQVVMPYITQLYGDDSLLALSPSYSFLSIMGFSRYFFVAVFRAPFVEEIFYRGLAFSLLTKYKKYHLDLVLSSAIFSLCHFWYFGWSTIDFLRFLVPGLLLGFYFKKTNCIYYTMVYHFIWNSMPYLFLGWR